MKFLLDLSCLILLLSLCGKQSMGQDVTCPQEYHINPKTTNRDTFLTQFKPCGHYHEQCQHKFNEWFGEDWKDYPPMEANTCYTGLEGNDISNNYGVYLVRFDTGLDEATYQAYLAMGDDSLIDDINGAEWLSPYADDFKTNVRPREETCLEAFVDYPEKDFTNTTILDDNTWGDRPSKTYNSSNDWGRLHTNTYNCMGVCGSGCWELGVAKDCMKHDLCSYFKTLALKTKAVGGAKDIDCGDEATQVQVNCWIRNKWLFDDEPVTCNEDLARENDDFYAKINPLVKLGKQKKAAVLRTSWDRNQGMPWARGPDGDSCMTPEDCISQRCEFINPVQKQCKAQLANEKRCNEHSDCRSGKCARKTKYAKRRCQPK